MIKNLILLINVDFIINAASEAQWQVYSFIAGKIIYDLKETYSNNKRHWFTVSRATRPFKTYLKVS